MRTPLGATSPDAPRLTEAKAQLRDFALAGFGTGQQHTAGRGGGRRLAGPLAHAPLVYFPNHARQRCCDCSDELF